jgi:hypothetical protein
MGVTATSAMARSRKSASLEPREVSGLYLRMKKSPQADRARSFLKTETLSTEVPTPTTLAVGVISVSRGARPITSNAERGVGARAAKSTTPTDAPTPNTELLDTLRKSVDVTFVLRPTVPGMSQGQRPLRLVSAGTVRGIVRRLGSAVAFTTRTTRSRYVLETKSVTL